MKRENVTIPVLMDCSAYGRESLKVNYTPTTFIIDEEGHIRSRMVGNPPGFSDKILEVLKKI